MSYNYSRYTVQIDSQQTTKRFGRIQRVEYDRAWGEQFLIAVPDDEMGEELFWMRSREVRSGR